MLGPRISYGDNGTWRISPTTLAFPRGRTTPTQPRPRPHPPQTLWQAYQLAEQWCWDRWKELEGSPPPPPHIATPTQTLEVAGSQTDKMPYKVATLQLHADLPKPHSSLLTQIRTGKIGLAAFLHQRRVLSFESPACPCGWQWETAKHVVLNCPRFTQERWQLRLQVPSTDFQRLTSNPRAAAAVTTWFLHLDLLPQFSWAREQLLSFSSSPLPFSSLALTTTATYLIHRSSIGWLPPRGRREGFSPLGHVTTTTPRFSLPTT